MAEKLRSGYTTGACAAAGAKAALRFLQGKSWHVIELTALDGTELVIPIKDVKQTATGICVEVVKFSGDDPDITNGVSIFTTVKQNSLPRPNIVFHAGVGVGMITKPGLSVPVGEPAINPGPRRLIENAVRDVLGDSYGLDITISIPEGVDLAKKTLNPVLGVEGGISIIGTTGVLRPMSEEAFKTSLVPQIDVAKAAGFESLIFVPGKIGESIALKWGLPQGAMVQTSNFIGYMLEAAAERDIKRILLFGHIGKLSKVAAGVFYTHNRIADGRMETLAAYGAAQGLSASEVTRVLESNTTEEALEVLKASCKQAEICQKIAERASYRAERYLFNKVKIGTVMVTLAGELLGMDETARKIGEDYRWQIPNIK